MAITRALSSKSINFKIAAPTGDDASPVVDNADLTVLLDEGESYTQTLSVSKECSEDSINHVFEAVLSLCAGTYEMQMGADLSAFPVVTKKIVEQYTLINE